MGIAKNNTKRLPKTTGEAKEPIARIAIVDDHPLIRAALKVLLKQQHDMSCAIEADTIAQAVQEIKDDPVDLAIVDLTLRNVGGTNIITTLRSHFPQLRILVLSMHNEDVYAERTLRLGACGYVEKHHSGEELLVAIRTILHDGIYLSPNVNRRLNGRYIAAGNGTEQCDLDKLSNRELEIFECIGEGLSTKNIADKLCRSIKTIEAHKEHIKNKLLLKNSTALAQAATSWVVGRQGYGAEEPESI